VSSQEIIIPERKIVTRDRLKTLLRIALNWNYYYVSCGKDMIFFLIHQTTDVVWLILLQIYYIEVFCKGGVVKINILIIREISAYQMFLCMECCIL